MNKYAFTLKLASAALQGREVGRYYNNAQQIATALAGIRKAGYPYFYPPSLNVRHKKECFLQGVQ